jgi:hypothetical protein
MQAAAASPWTMKTLPMLGNHLRDPTRLAGASPSFHSTPASFAKWRNKWDCHKVRPSLSRLLAILSLLHDPHVTLINLF